MIVTDEDSLICDLAETYHVFNYRELPVKLLATLSVGLRADSRIKLKISDMLLQKESEQLQVFVSGEDFVKAREKKLKGSD